MFKCPNCGEDSVVIGRLVKKRTTNRRTRQCSGCAFKFSTVEAVDYSSPITDATGRRYVASLDITKDVTTAVLARKNEDGTVTIVGEVIIDWAEAKRRCRYCSGLGMPTLGVGGKWVHAHMAWAPDVYDCQCPEIHDALNVALLSAAQSGLKD